MSTELLDCGHPESPHSDCTRGYAVLRVHTGKERRICYDCAAECDIDVMRRRGRITLYLVKNKNYDPKLCGNVDFNSRYLRSEYLVTNWPGSLKYPARDVRKSRMAAFGGYVDRVTARFPGPDGTSWWIDVRGDMQCGTARRLAT